MPIDIRIHINLSARQVQILRGSMLAGAVALALGAGVAAAMPKHSFSAGTAISAARMNENFEDLDQRLSVLEGRVVSVAAVVKPTSAGTCTIESEQGVWLAGTSPNGVGDCTLLFRSGFFSGPPVCTVTAMHPLLVGVAVQTSQVAAVSATSLRFFTQQIDESQQRDSAIAADRLTAVQPLATHVICVGPR